MDTINIHANLKGVEDKFVEMVKTILLFVKENNFETPSIFKGAEEEGEAVRMEWLTPVSHTVLTFQKDEKFYGFFLDVSNEDTASFHDGNLEQATQFIEKFVERNYMEVVK